MKNSWHSYPSIYNLGHRAVAELLNYPHVVEEKVDGSQFSFGIFEPDDTHDYIDNSTTTGHVLRVRSKGAVMNPDAPEKMFNKAVETVRQIQHLLHPGWTYRCEYLAKPKHNVLAYDRTPRHYLIGFDVSTDDGAWLGPVEKADEFDRIGLESVPTLWHSRWAEAPVTLDQLRGILDNTRSILGGQLIEGVVIKPLVELYGVDKKTLMGKFVSERFKESHKLEWREISPNRNDIIDKLVAANSTPARYQKSVQHLREAGRLTDSPKDIGLLMKELEADIEKEQADEIKHVLFTHFWPQIVRGVKRGLPDFYKNELLRLQFERGTTEDVAKLPYMAPGVGPFADPY